MTSSSTDGIVPAEENIDSSPFHTLKPPGAPVYRKPKLETLGSFRELTRWGFTSATDGGSIFGVTVSSGCQTTWNGQTWQIGCPENSPSSS